MLLYRPPVRAVRQNQEVVVFQPCTGTAMDLGSVTIIVTIILASSAPPVSTVSGSFYFLPPSYHPPHQQPFVVAAPFSVCSTRSPPPLPVWNTVHLNVAHTRHPPASAACLCALIRMSASAAVYLVRSPPLFCPWPAPRSLSSPGGFTHRGSFYIHCASASPSLCSDPTIMGIIHSPFS